MTRVADDELRARLDAITQGPWAEQAQSAHRELAPIGRLRIDQGRSGQIDLARVQIAGANKRKNDRLWETLRPHFEEEEPEFTAKQFKTRDALDQALTIPQLYELAVETGYLPEHAIIEPARTTLTNLLWSPAVRRFVDAYDYVAVPMLAARVGVEGVGASKPPEANPNCAIHFAGFLAHLRVFYSDEAIEIWLRFLDDYIAEDNEQQILWDFLRSERLRPPKRIGDLLNGCQRFVTSLANAFEVLNEDELARFGLMHAYWLQRFFGYERGRDGKYVKSSDIWGEDDSWAKSLSESSRLVLPGTDPEVVEIIRRQFREDVTILERVFAAVRQLVFESRQAGQNIAQELEDH